MDYEGNEAAQKENKKIYPENKLKDMFICDLNDRDFKITILKKFKEIQENTDRQLVQ